MTTTTAPLRSDPVPVLRGVGLAFTVLACLPFAAIGAAGVLFGAGTGRVALVVGAVVFLAVSAVWPVGFWRATREAATPGRVLAPLLPGVLVLGFATVAYTLGM